MAGQKGYRAATQLKLRFGKVSPLHDKQTGYTSEQIAHMCGLKNSGSATRALRQLASDGWRVTTTREGGKVYYKILPPARD